MGIKSFENDFLDDTSKDSADLNETFQNSKTKKQRVDINILKSKLRERENIILRKNILILVTCLVLIISAGISVTYL